MRESLHDPSSLKAPISKHILHEFMTLTSTSHPYLSTTCLYRLLFCFSGGYGGTGNPDGMKDLENWLDPRSPVRVSPARHNDVTHDEKVM